MLITVTSGRLCPAMTSLSGHPATSSSAYNIEVTCNINFEAEGYKQDLRVYFDSFSSTEEHSGSEMPWDTRPVLLVVLPPVAPPTTLRSHDYSIKSKPEGYKQDLRVSFFCKRTPGHWVAMSYETRPCCPATSSSAYNIEVTCHIQLLRWMLRARPTLVSLCG